MCSIKKMINGKERYYGFVGTGNLNEDSAHIYSDYFLLTSHPEIMSDICKIFQAIERRKLGKKLLKSCKLLVTSPARIRKTLERLIKEEIDAVKKGEKAIIKMELNSLSDEKMISQTPVKIEFL